MDVRRIVTGHDQAAKSVIVTDGPASNSYEMKSLPGFVRTILWATNAPAQFPAGEDPAPAVTDLHPGVGETRCLLLTLPPDSSMGSEDFDPQSFFQEGLEHCYGIFNRMEPDQPGMHQTDSVDYVMLVDGEVWLELDDGESTRVRPHDVVIQNGTRHAWRNKSSAPATLLAILIGARRREA
ncbi:MAG: cupin [Alphaproteobacteria bacterium]|nr:cupin [Alphaproteobacteria bacterium]